VFRSAGGDRAHHDAAGFDSKNGEGSDHAFSVRPPVFPDEHGPESSSPRVFINPGVEKARRLLFGRRVDRAEEGKGFPQRFPRGIQSLIPSPGEKPPLIRKVIYQEGGLYPADDRFSPPPPISPGGRGVEKNPVQEMRGRDVPRINPVNIPEKTPSRDAIEQDAKGQYVLPIVGEKRIGIISSSTSGKPAAGGGPLPDSSLLKKSRFPNRKERDRETQKKALELERTLKDFGIEARVIGITRGPVITRYELQPAPGVKLSRIVNLSDNIALSLSANGVRIEAPIPGRSAVGIEIPNDEREIVTFGDIINEADVQGDLPLLLGRNITGNVVVSDLTAMPHLLIAGATGSGKSVCVNSLIMSLLFLKRVEDVRFIMIDPKMVELKMYNGIPHLLTEVVTDPRNASKALRWVIREMEKRYMALDEHFVRDIRGYNQKVKEKMPYIIVIVDEFANLMVISQKDVEEAIVRLAAMSRAVGIHLIMATQRPSVDVITGLIKANFPYRIAFQVASKIDSRTILDSTGAEKLLGRGDMLFSPAGSMNIQRVQGAFITEDEVYKVVQELKKSGEPDYVEEIFSDKGGEGLEFSENDPMFDEAVEIVLKTKRASASFIQRRLKIGYNRSARLIELMEEKGIIGPQRGSKPRDIYVNGTE
jgi:DNA segregation ATPase FtsK/SpoIIIE, S-DNA-T family